MRAHESPPQNGTPSKLLLFQSGLDVIPYDILDIVAESRYCVEGHTIHCGFAGAALKIGVPVDARICQNSDMLCFPGFIPFEPTKTGYLPPNQHTQPDESSPVCFGKSLPKLLGPPPPRKPGFFSRLLFLILCKCIKSW